MVDYSLESLRVAAYKLSKDLKRFRTSIDVPLIGKPDEEAAAGLHESIDSFGKLLRNYMDINFTDPEVDNDEIMEELEYFINKK